MKTRNGNIKLRHHRLAVAAMLAAMLLVAGFERCQAHNRPVHKKISDSAARSSDGLSSFLGECGVSLDFPEIEPPPLSGRGSESAQKPIEWIKTGSREEDEDPFWTPFSFSIRSSDHFYTLAPVRARGLVPGLTDGSEFLGLAWGRIINSYRWGLSSASFRVHSTSASTIAASTWPIQATTASRNSTRSSPVTEP